MFTEDQLLPISALQHLLFCERQCALIHVERVWSENHLTVQGQHLHKKAHSGPHETRQGVRVARGLDLRSFRLGLVGKADVVEFAPQHRPPDTPAKQRITPVEYKRGRPKKDDSDRVQLCAQAICLEEMMGTGVLQGEIFYGQKRRRVAVEFGQELRRRTEAAARRLHEMVAERITPLARYERKCDSCSLIEHCLPGVTGLRRSASKVFERRLAASLGPDGPETDFVGDAQP